MLTCPHCNAENAHYDRETRMGHCDCCGFNFIYRDLGVIRQKSLVAIECDSGLPYKIKAKKYIDAGIECIKNGDYVAASDDFSIANGISAGSVLAMAGRFKVICLTNPDRTIYEVQKLNSGHVLLDCIESMATEEDYAQILSLFDMNIRRDRFEFWYDGLKEETKTYWDVTGVNLKKYKGIQVRKHAIEINHAMHNAARVANKEQMESLKELCRGNDLLIVDRIVYGHLGFITGSNDALIPEGVNYIFRDAFKHCRLNNVKLPKTLLEIDNFAFYDAEINNLYMGSISRVDPPLVLAEHSFVRAKIGYIAGDVSIIKNSAFRLSEIGEAKFGVVDIIGTKAFSGSTIKKMSVVQVREVHDKAFEEATIENMEIGLLKKADGEIFKDARGNLRVCAVKDVNITDIIGKSKINVDIGGPKVEFPSASEQKFNYEEKKEPKYKIKNRGKIMLLFASLFGKKAKA